ncbi:SpoIIE family protein phosphatase [Streptomyces sp. H10-C2]|uniref:SpoIIE family protein phosphatase n=1 Tax=unclassified Streptomyces TaxID=2593676 RepID=UPI0024BA5885|nr:MULTISPECIES: SpoIIE family protein phosphatase [unclassified Streptomyces]MDJ0342725.1 SpoIIE family protein phosphatase [Streptomyces sp. PH10-H1]MDJ0372565.1 SpoIIE family protein phosphatase [Streptomyces sp. H10-C2]
MPAPLPDPRGGFRLPPGSERPAGSDRQDQPATTPPQAVSDDHSARDRDRQAAKAAGTPRRDPTADATFASTPPRGTAGPAGSAMEPAGHPRHEEPAGTRIPAPATPASSAVPAPSASEAPATRSAPEAERLRYVGAATRRIARGLDLDEILLGLCRSAVPAFADAILVYLRDPLPVGDERPSGPLVLRLRRADGGLDEPSGQSYVGTVLPPVPAEPAYGGAAESTLVRLDGPLAEVLRGVRPVFAESPQSAAALEELLRFGEGPAASAGASRSGLHPEPATARNDGGQHHVVLPTGRRAILAPLRGRRRVIGAAVLLRRPDRPPFESDDLLVAAQLATHTALGVDKAVLYGREAYIADALQREMLPDSLPQPTGVRLASRYLPAAESARVGGDWYDAIPLPGSRVALVVGDVMGHSMTSAAIMGQLRTTVQTLAGLDLAPQEVLYHLDEQAQRLGSDRMATCVYAVYDPIAHRLVVANAGHPPPILLHANGLAEVLRVPPGAPIGVGGVPFEAVELPAPAGATLVLYTDGLVESRTRDVWGGIELLRERLHDAATVLSPPPLEPLCDEILEILGPGDRDDDIALLAARFDGISPSDVAYWYLEPQPQTAGRARRLARQALRRWDLEHLIEPTELLVSEIVTNAVRYAERPITLRLLRTDVLRCEVGDDAPLLPQMRHAQPQDEGGRGLYLVSRMAQRWGATRLSAGKVVWFELAIP